VPKSRDLPERPNKLSSAVTTERAFSHPGFHLSRPPEWSASSQRAFDLSQSRRPDVSAGIRTATSFPRVSTLLPAFLSLSLSLCVVLLTLVKFHGGHLYKMVHPASIIRDDPRAGSLAFVPRSRGFCIRVVYGFNVNGFRGTENASIQKRVIAREERTRSVIRGE